MSKTPVTGGSASYTPTSTTTYKGRAVGAENQSYDCAATVFIETTGPYHKVYGGDVSVGSGFGEACKINQDATILAFNQTSGTNHVGAGTQLAAYALGVVNGFGTSQARTPTSRKNLTFANSTTHEFGGMLNQRHVACIPNYWTGAVRANTIANLSAIGPNATGNYKLTGGDVTLGGRSLGHGDRTTLYVEGNVHITGNITYQTAGYKSIADIPSFRLVVKGNIYVAPNVTELNGTFVAIPKDDNTAGKFYTCSNSFGPPSISQIQTTGDCADNLLTVFGSVIADTIKFTRSRGNVDNATVAERYNNTAGQPAEKFIYTPESWLTSDFGGTGDNDSFGSLPPVL